MDVRILFKGLIMGFSIAAPVGPIGLLCIQRTLAQGRAYGFASGLGAATADATYGLMAAFGLTFVATFLTGQQIWVRLVGGLFLLHLGLRTLFTKPAYQSASAQRKGLLGAYASTLILTLANPMTILSFVGILAGLGVGVNGGSYVSGMFLVLGVFLGSSLWWLMLSGGVGVLRIRVTPQTLRWINRISGAIIVGFGLWALSGLLP